VEKVNYIDELTSEEIETAKDPGLHIRKLHKLGLTADSINVAIVDQWLPENYKEVEGYGKNIVSYTELKPHNLAMHGDGVRYALCKVATNCKLHYWATSDEIIYNDSGNEIGINRDSTIQGIKKIIEKNKTLPEGEKVKVISVSTGDSSMDEVCLEALEEGIFPITTSIRKIMPDFLFTGGGCPLNKDRNNPDNYELSGWMRTANLDFLKKITMLPIDHMVYPNSIEIRKENSDLVGTHDFRYDKNGVGGLSWGVPYLAGIYAIACQINPDMKPQHFVDIFNKTTNRIIVETESGKTEIRLLNPVGICRELISERVNRPIENLEQMEDALKEIGIEPKEDLNSEERSELNNAIKGKVKKQAMKPNTPKLGM